jgi:hypothetical protein
MLSKCANPDCNEHFLYLCHGKLFRLEIEDPGPPPDTPSRDYGFVRIYRRTEYYWLCPTCSRRMTVAYQKGKGVVTILFSAYRAAS